MRIVPVLSWRLDGETPAALDERLLPLLEAIAATSSLAAAVDVCGVSYRAAWGLLREYQEMLGEPLANLERGRGASLTAAGGRMVAAHETAQHALGPQLAALAVEMGGPPKAGKGAARATLRIAASHDLVLTAIMNATPPISASVRLDIAFMGSLAALKDFADGRVDAAGFHVPVAGRIRWDRIPFLRFLRARRDRLIRFIDRDQGLILPRGNRAGTRNFRDIAHNGLRFVNRQPGSGTRLLIDQLLLEARIKPSELAGYGKEEFTHPAVAATVASGGADAGFGLRAAAAEYGLAFVPLVREHYYLAIHARDVGTAAVTGLTQMLRSAAFLKLVRSFPGYRAMGAGDIVGLEALTGP
ncbi:MAG: substrate-binding domain-containing protein [Betaproteobacteria bacterium]